MEMGNSTYSKYLGNHWLVFGMYWLAAFVLYLPAARAGMVGDMPYLFETANKGTLHDFLNPKDGIALYQVAAFNFYILIKLFGTNYWLWHLLYITMHALNGIVLYKLFSRLLADSGVAQSLRLAFLAVGLFIICPHASEVVVWKASGHHSLATLILFTIMLLVQKFLHQPRTCYAVVAAILFFYSSFSHEFFYLTPWFCLALTCYYFWAVRVDKTIFRRALISFFIPLVALFALHLTLLRLVKHTYVSHFGKLESLPVLYYLDKPLKYLYHVIFMGRFFPREVRQSIYSLCATPITIIIFYGLLLTLWIFVAARLRNASGNLKVIAFLSILLLIFYLFISPVYFADSMLVCYDRYVYPSLGLAALLVVLLTGTIPLRPLRVLALSAYAALNIWLAVKVVIYWKQSAYVIRRLMDDLPDPGGQTVLLLNLPDDLNGVPMISAEEDGRFRIMKNNLTPRPVTNKVYDVVAYNMTTMQDGAHVTVINDSMCHITLNQWGTWWMYGMLGAGSYENGDYKVNMIDEGHWYELTLKHPASGYLLLYQQGAQWKPVDWGRKNTDQY